MVSRARARLTLIELDNILRCPPGKVRVLKFTQLKFMFSKLVSYSLRQKSLGHFNQTLFSPFSCSLRPSQSCLSQFGHQILYTNIEGTRRPQSVPTIMTETVF